MFDEINEIIEEIKLSRHKCDYSCEQDCALDGGGLHPSDVDELLSRLEGLKDELLADEGFMEI